ncbi:hypothetical protein K4K58_007656 [Colletotrichum sp. SAR11_239]|nr:hypothetical protein K4K58_007656 [Colletotrichum sp. SAR11_239]
MITKTGVPGNKIIVGWVWDIISTAGCIADAEIKEIISSGGSKRQNRVVTHFLDASSHSDILVYDNNQWVGYMSESTKAARVKLSAGLGMAGTTDWASDLQQFNPVPKPAKDWASFIALAASGNDPKQSTITIGKWKDFTCEADVIVDPYFMTPANSWKAVDAGSAWREVVAKWFEPGGDKDQYLTFFKLLERTLKAGAAMSCESFNELSDNCDKFMDCGAGPNGNRSGAAAQFIWNSVIQIHKMYHSYWNSLNGLTGEFAAAADDMEDMFAPIPEEKTNQWLNILIDVLTIGTLGAAGPVFNGLRRALPAFTNPTTFENTKDTVLMLMGQTTTLAKDMLSTPD